MTASLFGRSPRPFETFAAAAAMSERLVPVAAESFAIPSSMAKSVIDDLRKYGKTRRGWLGVRIQSLDQELAESMGLPESHGALVAKVQEDGPAAKAGITPADEEPKLPTEQELLVQIRDLLEKQGPVSRP